MNQTNECYCVHFLVARQVQFICVLRNASQSTASMNRNKIETCIALCSRVRDVLFLLHSSGLPVDYLYNVPVETTQDSCGVQFAVCTMDDVAVVAARQLRLLTVL